MYQITHMYGGQYSVDLEQKSCSWWRYELTGIPCGHAIPIILLINENPFTYADDCYKKNAWIREYQGIINPITHQEDWPKSSKIPMIPPEYKQCLGDLKS